MQFGFKDKNYANYYGNANKEPIMYSYTSTTQTVPTLDEVEFALQRTNQLVQNATHPSHEYMAQVFRSVYPHVLNAVMTYEETEEVDTFSKEPTLEEQIQYHVDALVDMGAKYYSGDHPYMEGYPRLVLPKVK